MKTERKLKETKHEITTCTNKILGQRNQKYSEIEDRSSFAQSVLKTHRCLSPLCLSLCVFCPCLLLSFLFLFFAIVCCFLFSSSSSVSHLISCILAGRYAHSGEELREQGEGRMTRKGLRRNDARFTSPSHV